MCMFVCDDVRVTDEATTGASGERSVKESVGVVNDGSRGLESSHSSGLDISSLDATMQEIQDSLQELGGVDTSEVGGVTPEGGAPDDVALAVESERDQEQATPTEVEEEDEDSDSEDEGGI